VSSAATAGPETTALFAAIDRKDSASFVASLTDDAVFRFGSAPSVQGHAAIAAAVDGFFGTIASLSHTVTRVLWDGETQVCEGEVTYKRLNGTKITLPFADVFEYSGDLIAHYKIYMDIGPLYAE